MLPLYRLTADDAQGCTDVAQDIAAGGARSHPGESPVCDETMTRIVTNRSWMPDGRRLDAGADVGPCAALNKNRNIASGFAFDRDTAYGAALRGEGVA